MNAHRRHRFFAAIVAAVSLLSGCSLIVDPEEARVCRLVVAALEGGAGRIEVSSTVSIVRAPGATIGAASGVAITYRVHREGEAARTATVSCLFDPSRPSLPPQERIVAIETPDGSFSPSRLYMLKRFWLDTSSRL